MINITEDTIFRGQSILIPNHQPIGELYEDMYIIPIKSTDGKVKNHLIQSGKFYIREYAYTNNELGSADYLIDPSSLEDITDFDNIIACGCDLAKNLDITYLDNGEYNARKD